MAQLSPNSFRKVVLITGCSAGGIGDAMALCFARRPNYVVYASARNLSKIGDLPSSVYRISLDVTSLESIHEAVGTILRESGTIDILVNMAGRGCNGPLVEVDPASVEDAFRVNVFGMLNLTSYVCRETMIPRCSGYIVNVGSIFGYMPVAYGSVYSMTKAAAHMFSDGLRIEVEPFGVKVLTVAPGGVKSSIGNNNEATFLMREDTYYSSVADIVRARPSLSQRLNPMSTSLFAERLVQRIAGESWGSWWRRNYYHDGTKWIVGFICYYLPV